MNRWTETQEHVCRALAAHGGTADATAVAAWIGRTGGEPSPRRDSAGRPAA